MLCAAVAVAGAVAVVPRDAGAYTIASAISSGCHEQITGAALRTVRQELAAAGPLAADRNEQALIDDVEFPLPADLRDLGGASLLIGVRDNDLKGRQSNDVTELALVHGDPQLQREHCLRSSDDDEPDGSARAIANCRDFILQRIGEALAGLDGSGAPDPVNRTVLPVYLALRHRVDASLPTYYVRIGQAIHALEDSFTHTYRTADGTQITAVLNWVDGANGKLVPAVDGPPHANELDRCDDPDDLRRQRHVLATDAATAILRATLDPQGGGGKKMADATAIVDAALGYAPGCTFDNDWCDAPERKYGNGGGCSVGGHDAAPPLAACAVVVGMLLFGRRRRQRRTRRAAIFRAVVGAALLVASGAGRAFGQSPPAATENQTAAPAPADAPGIRWGASLSGAASVNYGGLAAAAGARARMGKHLTLGLDAEWNPWFAVNGASTIRAGAFNGYGTAILRVPLAYQRFDLRTTFNLGTSVLLIDLYGAPKWTTGVFFGFRPLGIEWEISRRLFLILDPIGYALPVPQLGGVPFAFPQYRATLGLEVYGG
jgi:MYXO-CTERM domain-containing protein